MSGITKRCKCGMYIMPDVLHDEDGFAFSIWECESCKTSYVQELGMINEEKAEELLQ